MKLYTSTGTLTAAVAYTYDGLDRLLARKLDANGDGTYETTERFVYDSAPGKAGLDDAVLVLDDGGNVVRRFLNGPLVDQIFAEEDGSGVVNWLLTDNLGSTRDVARYDAGTATTSVVDSLDYSAFGKVITETNSANTPLTEYTGRYRDPLTGDQFNRARWYDTDGIWLTPDPLGFAAGDTNLNRYVGNSPTNATDPSGLDIGWYMHDGEGGHMMRVPLRPVWIDLPGVYLGRAYHYGTPKSAREACFHGVSHWFIIVDGVGYGFYPDGIGTSDHVDYPDIKDGIPTDGWASVRVPIQIPYGYDPDSFKEKLMGYIHHRMVFPLDYNTLSNNCHDFVRDAFGHAFKNARHMHF